MIYFDNAATTRVSDKVYEIMQEGLRHRYANPSAGYQWAKEERKKVEKARADIADTLHAQGKEIYFTSGGSESDNWALRGIADAYKEKGRHLITSRIEHKAVLKSCEFLEKNGYEVTYIGVDHRGNIKLDELREAIRPDTILVSVMYANNEIGTLMKIKEIARIAHSQNALFHTDAVQAYGHYEIDCNKLGIDLLSASGHKFHGPKGVGFLYKRDGIRISPLIYGGAQEQGVRAGTEYTIGIEGMAVAAKEAYADFSQESLKIKQMRDLLWKELKENIQEISLVGEKENRAYHHLSVCIKGVNALNLADQLGERRICISTGSACNGMQLKVSHVLKAIGMSEADAKATIRISLSRYNNRDEISTFVEELRSTVNIMRQIY